MSFHESFDPTEPPILDETQNPQIIPPELLTSASLSELNSGTFNVHELTVPFRDLVAAIMTIREEKVDETPEGVTFEYQGNLLRPADEIFPELNTAIEAHGYTLYMEREGKFEQILIKEGLLQARNIHAPWWFHLVLLLATLATTLFAAALLHGYTPEAIQTAVANRDRLLLLQIYRQAREFALPLLLILGIHEMGHYVAARLNGAKVTLPFFIPLPITGSLGTLGAVIFIKSPFRNRKQLFDVGIAGPLAGLFVAILIFISAMEPPLTQTLRPYWLDVFNRISAPPLLDFIANLLGKHENLDKTLFYNRPRALAAWFGVLLTSFNLLPMGQFDGGHVAFAIFGRRIAWSLARITALTCFFLGVSGIIGLTQVWPIWLIWPIFALLTGLHHPPPHDDITPLGWPRLVLGYATFLLFFTMIVITPFYVATR
jgi:membrane-associated protease RseP (regulator of RpoE activity)